MYHIRRMLINSLEAFLAVKCLKTDEFQAEEEIVIGKVRFGRAVRSPQDSQKPA